MKIIKLSAIDSTNSFLKELTQNSYVEDYTVVVTSEQTSGRGQMNSSWHSQPHKNLTFSIFTRLNNLKTKDQTLLSFNISLAVFDTLKSLSVPDLKIKWPNDIMSGNQKICGILIETTFVKEKIKNVVIGIGLNVNQKKFPDHLKNASSLKNILKKDFDLDAILKVLLEKIQLRISEVENHHFQKIHNEYHDVLYKKDIPCAFKNEKANTFFMGIIKGVSKQGSVQIQLEDDSIAEFGIKEISLAKV